MRPSSIDQLPTEVREAIGSWRAAGLTIDAIRGALDEAYDIEVPRATLGRHTQKLDRLREKLQESRHIAEALKDRMPDGAESQQMRLLCELMAAGMFNALSDADELDARDQMFLSSALRNIAQTLRTDAGYLETVRKTAAEAAAETAREAAASAAAAVGEREGLSAETLRRIRQEIYGLPA